MYVLSFDLNKMVSYHVLLFFWSIMSLNVCTLIDCKLLYSCSKPNSSQISLISADQLSVQKSHSHRNILFAILLSLIWTKWLHIWTIDTQRLYGGIIHPKSPCNTCMGAYLLTPRKHLIAQFWTISIDIKSLNPKHQHRNPLWVEHTTSVQRVISFKTGVFFIFVNLEISPTDGSGFPQKPIDYVLTR